MSNPSLKSLEAVQSIVHATVQQYFAASRSANKAEAMADCFAENCSHQDPVGAPVRTSPAEICQFLQAIVDLFASVELTEDFVSIHGQEAAVKWTGRGTGKNGCEVTFEGIDLFEINPDGKIRSVRAYWNPADTLAQLQDG